MYSYDLDQAVAEMKLAWGGDAWDLGFKFTLLYNAGNLPRKTACDMVSQKWAYIGTTAAGYLDPQDPERFQVAVQALAWPTILGKIFGTRDMPMFQIGWLPDYPHADNFIVPFMGSSGTFSYFQGYGDAELDAQIAAAFQETDIPTQLEMYAALQQRYYDDAPGIVLAQPIARRYFTAHITNFVYNPCESSYAGQVYDLVKQNNGGPVPFKNPDSFIQETIGDAESLDPAWCYDTASGENIGHMYETLIYYAGNSTDTFDPILATDTGSFNGTHLRFTINEGVPFHAGGTLSAADVEYSFERAMTQDRPGGPIWMFYQALLGSDVWGYDDTTWADIDASVAVNGSDVVFALSGDYWELPFKQVLCGQWASIVDKEWCIAEGDWDGTEADIVNHVHPQNPEDTVLFDNCNGTGPWELQTWTSGVSITKTAFADYWDGVSPFTYLYYNINEEWSSRKLKLLAGDADLVYVPATNFAEMDEEEGLNVYYNLPSLSIDAFFFNMAIAEAPPEE
jgi:ABC-type transport system substrate-binding protein